MYAQTTAVYDEATMQRIWLKTFLSWLTPVIFGFGLLEMVAFLVWRDTNTGLTGAVILAYGCCLVAAWNYVNSYQLRSALVLTCGGLLCAALVIVIVQPGIVATLTIIPLLTVAVALPYISGATLRALILGCWLLTAVIAMAGDSSLPHIEQPSWFSTTFHIGSLIASSAMVLLLLWQFSSRLRQALGHAHRINNQLQTTLNEVQARAAIQAQLLAENEQQRDTIRELSAPILPINQQTLLIPLIGSMDRERLVLVREQALAALYRSHARRLVLDITGIAALDQELAQEISTLGQAARLLGADVILVGVRATVARHLIQLRVDLDGIESYRDLEMALTQIAV